MTAVEVELRGLIKRFDEHITVTDRLHHDIQSMNERIEVRVNKMELRWAQLVAILSVVILIANTIGPVIASVVFHVP